LLRCQRGQRAFTLVEFDLSGMDENAEICMASISMQQTDRGVNVSVPSRFFHVFVTFMSSVKRGDHCQVGNLVAYPVTSAFQEGDSFDATVRKSTLFSHFVSHFVLSFFPRVSAAFSRRFSRRLSCFSWADFRFNLAD